MLTMPEGDPSDLILALIQTRYWNLKPGQKRDALVIFKDQFYPLTIRRGGRLDYVFSVDRGIQGRSSSSRGWKRRPRWACSRTARPSGSGSRPTTPAPPARAFRGRIPLRHRHGHDPRLYFCQNSLALTSAKRLSQRFYFMKATIKTQGQQFTITEGDILIVNRFPNTEAGATVQIKDVLTAGEGADFKVGKPTLAGRLVSAKILENKRGDKGRSYSRRRSARATSASRGIARSFPSSRSSRSQSEENHVHGA